ncbi:polyprenol phosphomannose-dependent alpha 1,6 mannosyltransferase MptB [Actinoplanes sp. NPDC051861]|uniref:polyprenol phosphomannose-dependent alpha 1,6 mannosyltransferase MptB n=1 Tax=Actinoplanes sp. NPDC051861 TaxID=3155170 RepID=UPI003422323D
MTTHLAMGQWLGVAGSGLIAVGGVFVGVGPGSDGGAVFLPTAAVYLGMTLLTAGWFALRWAPVGELIRAGVMWATPFLLSGPVFSRDVYSYVAQGVMTVVGLDPYRFGPSALGGELAVNVPPIWQDTPAPYGPAFLGLAGSVTTVTQHELWPGLVGMRVLAVAGIALTALSVHRIARECGVDPAAAVWLGVLNPLVLLHLVVDAHNEAVMIGLMSAGLALALRHRPASGAVLITLAGLVKGPALLGLAFVAVAGARGLSGKGTWVRATAATALTATTTALAVTALTGTGFGWIPALRTPTLARTWMSITTDLGTLLGQFLDPAAADRARHALWLAGLTAAGLIILMLLRRTAELGPVTALGLALTALVVLSPVVHTWYLLWGFVPLAAAAPARVRRLVAYATPPLILVTPPNGAEPGTHLALGALIGVAAGLAVFAVLRTAQRRDVLAFATPEPSRDTSR